MQGMSGMAVVAAAAAPVVVAAPTGWLEAVLVPVLEPQPEMTARLPTPALPRPIRLRNLRRVTSVRITLPLWYEIAARWHASVTVVTSAEKGVCRVITAFSRPALPDAGGADSLQGSCQDDSLGLN